MISLTRINQTPLFLNSDLIEHVQAQPDTVITLTTGHNFRVIETPDQIISRIVEFRRCIFRHSPSADGLTNITAAPEHSNG